MIELEELLVCQRLGASFFGARFGCEPRLAKESDCR